MSSACALSMWGFWWTSQEDGLLCWLGPLSCFPAGCWRWMASPQGLFLCLSQVSWRDAPGEGILAQTTLPPRDLIKSLRVNSAHLLPGLPGPSVDCSRIHLNALPKVTPEKCIRRLALGINHHWGLVAVTTLDL